MTTRNYNAVLPRKVLIVMLALGDMTVSELSAICEISTPGDEKRLLHTLACHRYNSLMQDDGPIWKLTESGRDYAQWAATYPQRFRRLKGEAYDPKAIHDAEGQLTGLHQPQTDQTTRKPI